MKKILLTGFICVFLAVFVSADAGSIQEKSYDRGPVRDFTGQSLKTIAFPIGGLGTGNITLGGRGDIHELEIFNRPRKGIHPDMSMKD